MKDEIKEILNQLEHFNEEDYKYYSDFKLNRNQIKLLLDYIINLQEEKTRIRKILIEHIEEARHELNEILHSDNDLNYKNECSREFEILNKNIRMILNKIDNNTLQGEDKDE